MGEIKSALEIALERTAGIQSDKGKLEEHDLVQTGKRITSKFLHPVDEEETIDLKADLKKYSGKQLSYVKQGIFEVMMSNISLPFESVDTVLLGRLQSGLEVLLSDRKQISYIFKQITQFFEQYLQNKEQIRKSLEERFGPKLRQKEQAMAERFGQEVHLEAAADPEFVEYLRQNYVELDKQYNEALAQLREQLRSLFQATL